MFRKIWWKPGIIVSDEGFSILPKRDCLVYREGNRTVTVTVEMGVKQFTVFRDSVVRWDEDPEHPILAQKTEEIVSNIRRALESQGQHVDIV
jgi:hypothetical protein